MSFLAAAAAAAGLANSGLQFASNKKLLNMQIDQQNRMFDKQTAWEKEKMLNAYSWTMQDLEKAGLNPTLMMGDVGSANMAGSSSPGAPSGGNAGINALADALSAMKMSKELGLMDAQKENIDADTKNKTQQFELTPELTKSVIDMNNSQSALNYQEKENKFNENINIQLRNHAQEIANKMQDMDYNKRREYYNHEMAIYIGEMQAKLKELGLKDSVIYQAIDAAFDTAGKLFRVVNVNSNNPGTNISKTTNINSPTVNY